MSSCILLADIPDRTGLEYASLRVCADICESMVGGDYQQKNCELETQDVTSPKVHKSEGPQVRRSDQSHMFC